MKVKNWNELYQYGQTPGKKTAQKKLVYDKPTFYITEENSFSIIIDELCRWKMKNVAWLWEYMYFQTHKSSQNKT